MDNKTIKIVAILSLTALIYVAGIKTDSLILPLLWTYLISQNYDTLMKDNGNDEG